jgi:hypothetical protein
MPSASDDTVGLCILDWQNEIFAAMDLKNRRVPNIFRTGPLKHCATSPAKKFKNRRRGILSATDQSMLEQ